MANYPLSKFTRTILEVPQQFYQLAFDPTYDKTSLWNGSYRCSVPCRLLFDAACANT
jgi:hypothetical protein